MPKYKVLDSLRHNGKRYKPGTDNDVVEMSEAAAAKIRPGVLKLVDDSAAKAAAEKAAEQKNTSKSEAQAAGDQEGKAEGAGAPAEAGTASRPAGKKKGAQ